MEDAFSYTSNFHSHRSNPIHFGLWHIGSGRCDYECGRRNCWIFDNKSYFKADEDYYMVSTDFLALSEKYLGKVKTFTDADLIRTGKVVRDEVAARIYELDNIKNSEWASDKTCYTIPLSF